MNTLIVDDNENLIRPLKTRIEKTDCKVFSAKNGAEAISKAFKNDIHLIVMDISMPVLDGAETSKSLRNKGFKGKILILTGTLTDKIKSSLKDYCDGFYEKPYSADLVQKIIEIKQEFDAQT